MIGSHRVAALVPARGGSKGLPGKNLRILAGKTLLRWTLDVAKEVAAIDTIYVSTDDRGAAREARSAGVEVLSRPRELASDQSPVIDTVRHHLERWQGTPEEPSIVVLLQPTSPLRCPEDIEAALRPLHDGTHDSAATFTRCATHPHRLWRPVNGSVEPYQDGPSIWLPRQELPELYEINGAVYAFFVDRLPQSAEGPLFGRVAPVLMPPERSIDIDDLFDLLVAETLLARTVEGPS